ncbi:PEP-CTERM sorting domain-containing protein [Massilia sp. ST3]|uniref:PEP-CTERM sorting domain-containing protein n=1 Tax=Massilia sp. ST3 TaxID=2824903 RepID=UPI001B8273BB|nr:PEP-CTERM sorting domain-containing protein [Massilia sp. ST3]MBQ5947574.1 PEP-CTERM sorting domain-containing protein [Massilia sp. ST3]
MSIRRLVVAALLASAGVAHAEVVTAPSFLTNWTTGNGTDVIASGALGGNVNLIGGISHTTGGASASLEDVLFGKASASLGNGTQLRFENGIQGSYLIGSDNGALAARLGNNKSVVNTNDGVTIIDTNPGQVDLGGGVDVGVDMGGGATGSTPPAGGGKPGLGNGSGTAPGVGPIPGAGAGQDTSPGQGSDIGQGADEVGQPAEVPEPSTVALMLAGVAGAFSLAGRRRKQ